MRQGTETGNGKAETGNGPAPAAPPFPASRFPFPRLRALRRAVRLILGMPDYDAYREHHAACHAGEAMLTPGEFFAEHLKRRYEGGGPSRCC